VAGFRPSKRRHKVDTDVELKLIPVMSLLVVLVPMLLQTAVFEQIAAVQLNLPSSDDVTYNPEPTSQENTDSVSVAITDSGFRIISSEKTLKKIPKLSDGSYDMEGFSKALTAVKKKFKSQEAIILLIEDGVLYDDIIHTMDKSRPLFPGVSLAPGLQEPVEGEGGG
jgi:hypothetical protein